jgi:hypothetical protein
MTEDKLQKKAIKMEIKLDEAVAGGNYANLCIVNHSDSEFVMDFVFVQPGRPKARVSNRVILSPKNAKRLLMLLEQQVRLWEKRFGKLEITAPQPMEPPVTEVN